MTRDILIEVGRCRSAANVRGGDDHGQGSEARGRESETGMNVLELISRRNEAEAEVRAEIWRLGVRHVGWPLEGALDELREPNLPMARAVLLRACVEKMRLEEHP
jgi:hypothetical protein